MTQHDLQTLKGTKPQERMSRIDLLPRFALTQGSAPAVQSILTGERDRWPTTKGSARTLKRQRERKPEPAGNAWTPDQVPPGSRRRAVSIQANRIDNRRIGHRQGDPKTARACRRGSQ